MKFDTVIIGGGPQRTRLWHPLAEEGRQVRRYLCRTERIAFLFRLVRAAQPSA